MAERDEIVIRMLGRFEVRNGRQPLPLVGWPTRRAAELVQLLALADGHRLHRERVIDVLWPHLPPEAGAANLRKAAHHARQALQDPHAITLRAGQVRLFAERPVRTDIEYFEAAAAAALRAGEPQRCAEAAELYSGELLPESPYEDWTLEPREQLRARHLELLRLSGSWERVIESEPTDEPAYCALMRQAMTAGDHPAALRWYSRLTAVLHRELGVRPGPEAYALRERCLVALRPSPPPLVGRAAVLAEVEAALERGARGELHALVLRGPAGIGKTAHGQALCRLAADRGWWVLRVQSTPDSGPYVPLVAAVEQVLHREPNLVEVLPEQARSVLAQLTPTVGAKPADQPVTRHQVVGATRRLLLSAGRGRGVLLLVDDVHLADDDGASALMHLAGTSAHGVLLVVLAHRAAPDRTALVSGVARLERADQAVVVDLAPLDQADATDLVRAVASPPPPDAVVTRICDRAAGNPFFLLELTRHACAGDPLDAASSLWESITRRFVEVDGTSLDVLRALAVAGEELEPATALALTGLPEGEAFALLDRALAEEILVATETGYAFRHALVRQALQAQVPAHRRAGIHRDAARRLAAAGAAPQAVARHWLAAGRPERALPLLEAAARHAVRVGAFADALTHLDVLLTHDPCSATALHLRAEALEALGDPRAPTAFAAAALAAPADEQPEIRARQALASVRAGDPAGAVRALEGVEARTLGGRLAQALAMAGAAAMGYADPDVGVERAAETRRLAISSGEPSAVVVASWAEAAAAHAKGRLPTTLWAGLQETYALPELAITTFDGHLCVAERLLYGYQPYPQLIDFADALEQEAVRRGAARGRAFATTLRGEAELLSGDLDAAAADLQAGARLHRDLGAFGGESLALQRLAELALQLGDRARAHVLLDEALAVARDSALGFHLFDRIYGTRIAAASDAAAGLAAVEEAEDAVYGSMETCPGCRITLAVPAALAAARAGDLERARAYEAAAEKLTVLLMRLPGWHAALEEVRGERVSAEGDRVRAGRHLRDAAALFRQAGQPLDVVRCETAAAQLS